MVSYVDWAMMLYTRMNPCPFFMYKSLMLLGVKKMG
jgi:hypothetical protein